MRKFTPGYAPIFAVLLALVLGFQALTAFPQALGCSDNWDTTFTSNGADDQINAIASDGNGNIYFGGEFNNIQGMPANGIAKWNGTSWSALGSGINGDIFAIAISGNDVYVGGSFNVAVSDGMARNVAKWDGTQWTRLGNGLGGGTHLVRSIAVYGGEVYIGGNFNTADGSPSNGIVKWNGTAYSALPIAAGDVRALAVNNGSLYAGGFVAPTTGSSVGILQFDGTTWTALGAAANTSVTAIAFSGNDVYVVGDIRLTGQPNSQAAKFDGTAWTRMAGVFSGGIMNAVAIHQGELYVGGSMTDPPNAFNSIARWNGTSWVGVGSGGTGNGVLGGTSVSERVMSLASIGGTLYVGGNYTMAGGQGARNISKYASGTWTPFSGTGLDGTVSAIAVSGNDVYVGGNFSSAGTATAGKIAKWNNLTGTWTALGTGIVGDNTSIQAIAVVGNKVYAGGTFTSIGGVSANNIAVWNGTTWSAMGTGANATVRVIIARGDELYIGGDFTSAGGQVANRVARWNGSSWNGLGSTILPTSVVSMAFKGNDLYVTTPTTTVANPAYFSKYDGTTWTALGGDLGDRGVSSVAVIGDDIYVSGGFTTINGVTVNRIAKYNNGTWTPLGNGLPPVGGPSIGGTRLITLGSELISIGDFTLASGGPANRIGRWNGTAWTGFGTGANDTPFAAAAGNGDLFVGGPFSTTGCRTSPYFSRWRETVWNGSAGGDWHNSANWGGNTVPPAGSGVSINAGNASISTADVTVSSLVVGSGRTLTVGAGRTLIVNGRFDITNGTVNGPGTIVVNGDLTLNGGTIAGANSLTVNGNLNLVDGTIAGNGPVNLTTCRLTSLTGGSATSYISSPFTRCVDRDGTYRFPVGSGGVYAPVELSNIVGNGNFTVEPKTGAYVGGVGFPVNRLNRHWVTSTSTVTQADITFTYADTEVVGLEARYRLWSINGGNALLVPATINNSTNRATANGVTTFATFSMAEAPSIAQTLKGRVRMASGKGAYGVFVTLTDQAGNVRTAMTNMFGYYQFPGVMTWENYTIAVRAKRYTFATSSQTLLFPENSADINFSSTDH